MIVIKDTIAIAVLGIAVYGVAHMEKYASAMSGTTGNGCPTERNIGSYGTRARFDGITIVGSAAFVSKTVTALQRAYHIKSYRYISELDRIEERPSRRDAQAWIYLGTRTAFVGSDTANKSCTYYASILVHEGAHVVFGSGHGPVYAAQAQALTELNEPAAARSTFKLAANERP